MQANLLKVLAMAAVVLTVQSAPTGTTLNDVRTNATETQAAEIGASKTSEAAQADGVQAYVLPTVHLVRALSPRNVCLRLPI